MCFNGFYYVEKVKKCICPLRFFSFRYQKISFMQMARLERLDRNGSRKENFVVKCPKKEESRSRGTSRHWVKSWDLNLKLVERNLNAAIASISKQYKYWWKRLEEFCSDNGRQIEPFSDLTTDGCL